MGRSDTGDVSKQCFHGSPFLLLNPFSDQRSIWCTVNNTQEAVLRKELGMLSERQNRVQLEAQQLRQERDEMLAQFKELDTAIRTAGKGEHAW